MSTPDLPEDASSASPEPQNGDLDEEFDMAEIKESKGEGDGSPATNSSNGHKPSSNAKDPLRPRRKKARRACFACQRAHLTCGDERPCQRCIKRGLQNACQDGVRKKAKYLHDAPNEALMPGFTGNYQQLNGSKTSSAPPTSNVSNSSVTLPQHGNYYGQNPTATYNLYGSVSSQGSMGPPNQDMRSFNSQQSPISPYSASMSQQTSPIQEMRPNSMPQDQNGQNYSGPLFDPSDPALFNFDISSLNFGNHYGALEFGMLGHMSSGAADTPPSDNMGGLGPGGQLYGQHAVTSAGYDNPGFTSSLAFSNQPEADWMNGQSRQGSLNNMPPPNGMHMGNNQDQRQPHGPNAYAIGATPSSIPSASPGSTVEHAINFDSAPSVPSSPAFFISTGQQPLHYDYVSQPTPQQRQQHNNSQQRRSTVVASTTAMSNEQRTQQLARKRRRDASAIYDKVKTAYSYTKSFHKVQSYLTQRFSHNKRLRIARAMASYRPSLISINGRLQSEDLLQAEKIFQRTLWEYEDYIASTGTPTIICRRTGEIAAVSKEFTILSGWRKEVLLGFEPDLNINTGIGSGPQTGSNTAGTATPRNAGQAQDQNEPLSSPTTPTHPVFLPELLDDDSVVQFYEDFAQHAFADSRAPVMTQIKLLKYRTKEDIAAIENQKEVKAEDIAVKLEGHPAYANRNVAGSGDISKLGEPEGIIDCMLCWSVKRDMFEVPMLVVMNFLPIIEGNF